MSGKPCQCSQSRWRTVVRGQFGVLTQCEACGHSWTEFDAPTPRQRKPLLSIKG